MKKIVAVLLLIVGMGTVLFASGKARSGLPARYRLQRAVAKGELRKVENLLALNPGLDVSGFHPPPTMVAARRGDIAILNALVSFGFDPLEKGMLRIGKNAFYGTALCAAAGEGHLDVVKYLVEGCNASVDGQELMPDGRQDGWTPLEWAAFNGKLEVCRYLLKTGASVSVKDVDGRTALYVAAGSGRLDVARLLLTVGADAAAKDVNENTPLQMAAFSGSVGLCRLLLSKAPGALNAAGKNGLTPLHYGAGAGKTDVCEALLAAGAKVNARDKQNRTPLYLAATGGYLETCQVLVKHGADVMAASGLGLTPLHRAAISGNGALCEFLLTKGADIKAKSRYGYTPLDLAARQNKTGALRVLLVHGANVKATSREGFTPLHVAIMNRHSAEARMLLQWGADPNARDWDGWTPLHWACALFSAKQSFAFAKEAKKAEKKAPEEGMVRVLIAAGAKVNAVTNSGDTPLILAASSGDEEGVRVLLKTGADPNAANSRGRTPLDMAYRLRFGGGPIAKMLKDAGAVEVRPSLATLDKKLFRAMQMGDQAAFAAALADGADPNSEYWGIRALNEAVSCESTEMRLPVSERRNRDFVDPLLAAGADVDAGGAIGNPPLENAARYGNVALVKLFIRKEAKLEAKGEDGDTALYSAAARGHVAVVGLLAEAGADADAKGALGSTPLMAAAASGSVDTVKYLLDHGADVNSKASFGWSALHVGVLVHSRAIVRLLLDRGADPEAMASGGATPLDLAVFSGDNADEKLLRARGAHTLHKASINLSQAIREGDEDKLKRALDNGASVNLGVIPFVPPVFLAANEDKWKMTADLLRSGADPNSLDWQRSPLLFTLVRLNAPRNLLEICLDKGADVNTGNKNGSTVLLEAIRMGRRDLVEFFIRAGADLLVRDKKGRSVLGQSYYGGGFDASFISYLLDKGADMENRDKEGRTPLINFTTKERADLLKVLIERGANLNAADNDGNTALHFAAREGWQDGVMMLLEAGADASLKNKDGLSPIGEAFDSGKRRIADLIRLYKLVPRPG